MNQLANTFAIRARPTARVAGAASALALGIFLTGCSPQGPPTPITYRDALNPGLELTLKDGGDASVSAFPAVESGDCIEPNDWPSTILRDGEARWAIQKNGTLVVEGDGWAAELHYVWRRANPDFTELRYPTCGGDALNGYFLLESH